MEEDGERTKKRKKKKETKGKRKRKKAIFFCLFPSRVERKETKILFLGNQERKGGNMGQETLQNV